MPKGYRFSAEHAESNAQHLKVCQRISMYFTQLQAKLRQPCNNELKHYDTIIIK